MIDVKPSTWLGAGYAVDATNHLIKLNTDDAASDKLLAQLTDAFADPTTGDIRVVAFALMEALYQAWQAQPSTNRTKKMIVSRSAVTNRTDGSLQYVYSLRVNVTPPTGEFTIPAET